MGNIVTAEDIQESIQKWNRIFSNSARDEDIVKVCWKNAAKPGSFWQLASWFLKEGQRKSRLALTRAEALEVFKKHFLDFPHKLVVFHPNHLLAGYTFKPCYRTFPLYPRNEPDPNWHDYLGEWCISQSVKTIYFPLEATSFEKSEALYSNNPWLGKEVFNNLQPLAQFISREEAYQRIESDLYQYMLPGTISLELPKPELGDIYMLTSDC